jgi:hypothetical protein
MIGPEPAAHPASFRDPLSYVFESNGEIYRAVRAAGELDLDFLSGCGLLDELVGAGLMVDHDDLGRGALAQSADLRILKPLKLNLISYACEWTFAQLKAAALLTLEIQLRALRRGMTLKDASAFNVQFVGARPIFIDTLSFTRVVADGPWVAYRQFCEHFVAPLALMSSRGLGALWSWTPSLDGVSLPEASSALPLRSWLRAGVLMHVHLHALSGRSAKGRTLDVRQAAPLNNPAAAPPPRLDFALRLTESLKGAVQSLKWTPKATSNWSGYRAENTYSDADAAAKAEFVRLCCAELRPATALDLGANDGLYSALLAGEGICVTAVEADRACSEQIFQMASQSWPDRISTLRIDLTNPTPAHGWAGRERASFQERARSDLVLALALIHHLSIARHVPFERVAAFFASLGRDLIVEYVPLTDPMATKLLQARSGPVEAVAYSEEAFGHGFSQHFETLRRSEPVAGGRILFWMRRRSDVN